MNYEYIKGRKDNSRPEGYICEQFAYLLNLVAYLNSSDMNKLGEMAQGGKINADI